LAAAAFIAVSTSCFAQTAQPEKPVDATPKALPAQPLSAADSKGRAFRSRDTYLDPIRTYRLQAGAANDANEILTGLRLMLEPSCKMYLVPGENVFLVRCSEDQLVLADHLVRELDMPKSNYRLTYTVVESDGGKRIGVQHFSLTMTPGVRTTLKDGSKVPVATGSYNTTGASAQTQFTYLDVGLNFDATLTQGAGGLRLSSKVEQSASAEEKTIAGVTEPIIRQAVLEGSATLQVGKPVMLGSLDVAASTRHLDVEVLLEEIK
jgi:type II secretory pathway component GspD/PulD (secretin)